MSIIKEMKEKTMTFLMNILLNIILYAFVVIIVYCVAPLHEIFHYVPCKLLGLSPEMSYFSVQCNGINDKNPTSQFFYFMGPYIFYSIILITLYFLSHKHPYLRYLIPIPIFDVIFNYLYSLHGSDFTFLLQNTYPNRIPFIISMIIVIMISVITIKAYFKYQIYSFTEIIKKYFLVKRR